MSSLSASLLAQTIDDHIAWMAAWTRIAFYETHDRIAQTEKLPTPDSFAVWRQEAAKTLQDQPVLERLVELYDQIHRLSGLVILKTPETESISRNDFDSILSKYQEFITGLRRLERALATAASGLDTLTGLRSRTGMQDDLTRELSRFLRNGKPFCLALLDIDHFKKINDTNGHESGDRVLASVANIISRTLRPFDDAWRWGGEEFLLCLKEADIIAGGHALERVRATLEKTPITLSAGKIINITASFGYAATDKNSTIDNLLQQADKALYRAKGGGRNRVEAAVIGIN